MNILTELCQEIRNWFDRDKEKWIGEIVIDGSGISCDGEAIELLDGQYFRIIGSLLNDGVYLYPNEELNPETFEGAVWSMGIPPSVIALAEAIEKYNEKYATVISSPYQAEAFGGYSYSLGGGGSGGSAGKGNPASWRNHFADDLDRWRKL